MTTKIKMKAKAFSNHGIGTYRMLVESDGTVTVWDAIAGHYTACHALSDAAQRRARKCDRVNYTTTSALCGLRIKSYTFLNYELVNRVDLKSACVKCASRNRELMARNEPHGMNR